MTGRPRAYRGVTFDWSASGWWVAHVPIPGHWLQSSVIVKADTVAGIREAIADVLNGGYRGH